MEFGVVVYAGTTPRLEPSIMSLGVDNAELAHSIVKVAKGGGANRSQRQAAIVWVDGVDQGFRGERRICRQPKHGPAVLRRPEMVCTRIILLQTDAR